MSGSDDLFDESDSGEDTDDLISSARKSVPVKKKRLQKKNSLKKEKKKKKKKRKRDSDGSSSDGDPFDSEDDDDDPSDRKKSARTPRSKKERMEALAQSRRPDRPSSEPKASKREGKEEGYDSGDSVHSAEIERTKDDYDFIDASGEDPDALKELYREQHFDDEEASESEGEERRRRYSKSASSRKKAGPDAISELDGDPDNPIMEAVNRMKRKKKEKKKLNELESEARDLVDKMISAVDDDDKSIAERRPAVRKLQILPEVLDILTKKEMTRPLLDDDLLTVARRWIQPLPDGSLGNVTLRHRLLETVGGMNGENGINATDLKQSSFGKVVMKLYMHKKETPSMKRMLKAMIEQWSRPIFQKSGNMKDLDRVLNRRREAGLVAISRQQQQQPMTARMPRNTGKTKEDVSSILAQGFQSKARDLGNNRVTVPFSKGFQFTVRPMDRITKEQVKANRQNAPKNSMRDDMKKRMIDRGRPISKKRGSKNFSVDGKTK